MTTSPPKYQSDGLWIRKTFGSEEFTATCGECGARASVGNVSGQDFGNAVYAAFVAKGWTKAKCPSCSMRDRVSAEADRVDRVQQRQEEAKPSGTFLEAIQAFRVAMADDPELRAMYDEAKSDIAAHMRMQPGLTAGAAALLTMVCAVQEGLDWHKASICLGAAVQDLTAFSEPIGMGDVN